MRKVLILWDRRDVIRTRDLCVPKKWKCFPASVMVSQMPLFIDFSKSSSMKKEQNIIKNIAIIRKNRRKG